MSDHRVEALQAVVEQIAESVLFMYTEPLEDDSVSEEEEAWYRVSIEYHGSRDGGLTLWVPAEANEEITSNMLGDDIDAQESTDAIKEFVNMVCGNFITKLEGNEAVLDLRPPVAEQVDTTAKKLAATCQVGFNLDEYAIFFAVREAADAGREAA